MIINIIVRAQSFSFEKALTDTKVAKAKARDKVYRVADSKGLCLEVRPNGSKLWRYRYRLDEKASMFSLGAYPDVSLARNTHSLKRAMSKLIKNTLPTKKQVFENYICDDGLGMGPYKMKCAMWREGEKVIFDFEGTDPQSISSINFLLNEEMFKMFCGVYMIMIFDPQIMFNDGFYDLMEVKIPYGTLLKPREPAALSCRTHAPACVSIMGD